MLNFLLVIFGVGWLALAFAFDAVWMWNTFQAADNIWDGLERVQQAFGAHNYVRRVVDFVIFLPGILAIGWYLSRKDKAQAE